MNKREADAFAEQLAETHERIGKGCAKASQIAHDIQILREQLTEVDELVEKDRLDTSENEIQESLSLMKITLDELDRTEQHATELANLLEGREKA